MTDRIEHLKRLLDERIVLLDGSWGVLIQRDVRGEEAYRGERFRDHPRDVAGDPDLLNLTRPEVILDIHRRYFAAGADIATTNTFTATRIGQADYGLEAVAAEMSLEGARLARQAADEVGGFVAGSLGPLNVSLSVSPKVDDPGFRPVTFDQVYETYAEQITALRDGGVDLLMFETIFDTLNAKAAIAAALDVAPEVPRWVSFTAIDASGRNLSGQTVEAFWASIEHAEPLIVGVNCSLGAEQMRPYVEDLARIADTYVSCHPNAGLPNAFGEHDELPADTSRYLSEFAASGLVNVVGGCCGTTPDHVAAIRDLTEGLSPRRVPERHALPRFSGLEPFEIERETGFVMIGERTNVTGSARFRRLVEADDYTGAVAVALEQVQGGANLIDVNMDADLLDAEQAMTTFLNVIATEPEIARVPIMVDSSRFSAIEAGLKCIQGKGIANSISLKEGEESFLAQARAIRRLGAAAVVMAFDEEGQAATVERKVEICERAYRLLLGRGLPARGHRLRPERARGRHRYRGAQRLREGLHRVVAADQGALPRRAYLGRDLEPVVLLPRQRRRPRGHALRLPLPRDPRGPRHGDRQRRPADRLRGRRAGAAGARRGRALRPAPGRHRATGRVRGHRLRRGDQARGRSVLARARGGGAAVVRARPRDRRVHRGGRGGGEAGAPEAARRDRGPADGRDEDRRRPVRLRAGCSCRRW